MIFISSNYTKISVNNPSKPNVSKIYCEMCDLVFESKTKFEKHLQKHSAASVECEVCPIDTAIAKFVSLFRRKSSHNLE